MYGQECGDTISIVIQGLRFDILQYLMQGNILLFFRCLALGKLSKYKEETIIKSEKKKEFLCNQNMIAVVFV